MKKLILLIVAAIVGVFAFTNRKRIADKIDN